jgi:hypothetical protein
MEKLEKAKSEYLDNNVFCDGITTFEIEIAGKAFIAGANYQEERMYSVTEVLQLLLKLQQTESYDNLYEWFEQNKKK